jgi:histidinol-phosphate aminotransferase
VSAIPALRPDLEALDGYHSAQVEATVRLNTNESPFPPPERWRDDLAAAVASTPVHRYPDRAAHELRRAIGELHGVGPEEVFCANGSNEVLQTLLLAFGGPGRTALLFEPTYTLHRHISRITGTAVATVERAADFTIDPDVATRAIEAESPQIVFLCSPNNPTGRAEPRRLIEDLTKSAPGLVIVDEAYGQFAPSSAIELRGTPGTDGLVVVRTFSKTWAMAGLRLGYCLAHRDVVAACESVVLPYHLSALTQAAGLSALRYRHDMEQRVALIAEERGRLAVGLSDLGVETWPSDANFILFRPDRPAGEVWQGLLDRSVLVRDCSGWPYLEGCLRVTVGTPTENDAFLEALKECLR